MLPIICGVPQGAEFNDVGGDITIIDEFNLGGMINLMFINGGLSWVEKSMNLVDWKFWVIGRSRRYFSGWGRSRDRR